MIKTFANAPHSKDAYIYACHVVKGHKPACIEERQACQRFIDDLTRDFEFTYDCAKAEKACKFIEKMPHTKGRWAKKKETLILEPWEKFAVCNIFGWVNDKGFRRFRKVYMKVPRKNGKSPLAAAIGHYMFVKDDEFGAEVYSGATSEKQAWEVFGPARLMAKREPEYTEQFGIEVNAKSLTIESNGSVFVPIIGNPGDGSSPSCAIIDEVHEHKTDALISTMETGMGGREQPLLLMITTAGDNITGPCYDEETECKKLLDGVFEDNQIFTIMYGIDESDDWTDPEILKKANPNYGISVSAEFLIGQQKQAVRNASKQNSFKRKHLNQWVGAHTAWMNMTLLKNCVDKSLKIEDFDGKECYMAVDLASKIDIAAFVILFRENIEGKNHYYPFLRYYLPEERVLNDQKSHYEKFHSDGYLTATEGNEIDLAEIERDIDAWATQYGPDDIAFDPKYATQMRQNLEKSGHICYEFMQNVGNFSDPMYELEGAIYAGRLHYDGDPVLTWMFSNVVSKQDANDNCYPRKQKPENKIDGAVALIMAIGRFMANEQKVDVDPFLDDPISA